MASLELIIGPMFARKSEELIGRLRRETFARRKVIAIKPGTDNRTEGTYIASRGLNLKTGEYEEALRFPACVVNSVNEAREIINSNYPVDVIGFDEVHFFCPDLAGLVEKMLIAHKDNNRFRIIAAGLDTDAWRKPFETVLGLSIIATEVIKYSASCFICGQPAALTQKIGGTANRIEVGGKDPVTYQARCLACHIIPPPPV